MSLDWNQSMAFFLRGNKSVEQMESLKMFKNDEQAQTTVVFRQWLETWLTSFPLVWNLSVFQCQLRFQRTPFIWCCCSWKNSSLCDAISLLQTNSRRLTRFTQLLLSFKIYFKISTFCIHNTVLKQGKLSKFGLIWLTNIK